MVMWAPFLMLLLHKQNEIAAATNDFVTVTNMMFIIVPFAIWGWMNEQRDGYRFPTYLFASLVGFIWGIIRNDVLAPQVSAWVKVLSMLWFTYCAANLRLNWDIKRIAAKKQQPPSPVTANNGVAVAAVVGAGTTGGGGSGGGAVPFHLKAWNLIERNLGITFFFFIGEIIGFLAQPGGFVQLFDGVVSFASFIVAPVVSVKISQWVLNTFASFIAKLSGAQHQGGGANAERGKLVMLVVMIVLALGVFFVFVTWFWSSYLPWVMTQDQFVGALCMIVESIVFFQKKEESKSKVTK